MRRQFEILLATLILGSCTEAVLHPYTPPHRSQVGVVAIRALPLTQDGFSMRPGGSLWYEREGWWNPHPVVAVPFKLPPPNRAIPRVSVPIVTE